MYGLRVNQEAKVRQEECLDISNAEKEGSTRMPYITQMGIVSLSIGALGAGFALVAVEIASSILLGVGTLVTAAGAVVKVTDTFRRSRGDSRDTL